MLPGVNVNLNPEANGINSEGQRGQHPDKIVTLRDSGCQMALGANSPFDPSVQHGSDSDCTIK